MTRSIPILSGLNLVARDMDATLAFYRELGVDLNPVGRQMLMAADRIREQ